MCVPGRGAHGPQVSSLPFSWPSLEPGPAQRDSDQTVVGAVTTETGIALLLSHRSRWVREGQMPLSGLVLPLGKDYWEYLSPEQ